jgi:capsular polysaccharide biosynthesis protein
MPGPSIRTVRFAAGRHLTQAFPALHARMPFFQRVVPVNEAGAAEILTEEEPLNLSPPEAAFAERLPPSQKVPEVVARSTALVSLENVSVLGNTGAVISEAGHYLILPRDEKRAANHHDYRLEFTRVVQKPDANYVHVMGPHKGHRHIYHFYFDHMLRLYHLLERFALGKEKLVLLANDAPARHQTEFFGFLMARYPNVSVQYVPYGERWQLPKLYYPDDYQNTDRTFSSRAALEFLRDLMLPGYGARNAAPKRRLYLTREDTRKRRLSNEAALRPLLEKHGFEIVAPGQRSFGDQVRLFAEAAVVMGPHGAAFTDDLFSPPGTKVIEIFPANKVKSCYFLLSKRLDQPYFPVIGGPGDKQEWFSCDPALVKAALEEALG